ncbi:hypothetical protein WICMUC_005953 [Wickerhamomyces mucosus]|uniref:Protein kinase domain-containing protein n=1 Tax=Wickerhamomyces mucosus TaxID=1378264 RepID=A0A9P8P1G5_9ASCO|nr:hypothetical protein WICMUC_005953 [Wickerhamomyces mucosus]
MTYISPAMNPETSKESLLIKPKRLVKPSTTGHLQNQEANPTEKKKHKNPLKFFKRSLSHHVPSPAPIINNHQPQKPALSLETKQSSQSPSPIKPPSPSPHALKRASTLKQQHLSNPFLNKETSSAFNILGTGQDIAAPRRNTMSLTNHSAYINPTPSVTALQSRNPSQYSINSLPPDDEKKLILPLPIQDPNDFLTEKQSFNSLNEEFLIPEKGSSKDKKLGDGASSTVILIQDKKSHKSFAFKRFQLFHNETPDEFYKRAIKEFIIAKRLSANKHLIQTYYCLKIQTTTQITRGWGFVLEYCKSGDLFSLISRPGWRSSNLNEKYCLFKQIIQGVKFIHDNGYAHRDLKPENVLIDENGCCKLTDFGVAEFALDTDENEYHNSYFNPIIEEDRDSIASPATEKLNGIEVKLSTSFVGSPPYVSPEVMLFKQAKNSKAYNPFKLDYWSLGVILFCLVYQGTPFKNASPIDSQYREYLVAYSTFLSMCPSFKHGDKIHGPGVEFKYAKDFQSTGASRVAWRLCDPDPETRYKLDDVLNDPWYQNIECCQDDENQYRHNSIDSSVKSSIKSSPIIKPKSMLDLTSAADEEPVKNELPTLEESNEELPSQTENQIQSISMNGSMCDFNEGSPTERTGSTEQLVNSGGNETTHSPLDQVSRELNSLNIRRANSYSSLSSNKSTRSLKKVKHHHLDVLNSGSIKR